MKAPREWRVFAALCGAALLVACEGDDDDELDSSVLVDSGQVDAQVLLDAQLPDADSSDAGAGDAAAQPCFSPINLPSGNSDLSLPGCACGGSAEEEIGYCIERPAATATGRRRNEAVVCSRGQWRSVLDGPCEPQPALTGVQCGERRGFVVSDSDAGVALRCNPGQHLLAPVEGGGYCCKRLLATAAECLAAGYEPLNDPGDGSLLAAGCPHGKRVRSYLIAGTEGGLCCER